MMNRRLLAASVAGVAAFWGSGLLGGLAVATAGTPTPPTVSAEVDEVGTANHVTFDDQTGASTVGVDEANAENNSVDIAEVDNVDDGAVADSGATGTAADSGATGTAADSGATGTTVADAGATGTAGDGTN